MKKTEEPIQVEQTLNGPPSMVWSAITQVHQMRLWFFDNIPVFWPEVGFETQFEVTSENRVFLHQWSILEVIPLEKIMYNWKYEGYAGDSLVTFDLQPKGEHTLLTLTHQVLEDFPEDIPEFARDSCQQGWEFFIQKNLKEYLA